RGFRPVPPRHRLVGAHWRSVAVFGFGLVEVGERLGLQFCDFASLLIGFLALFGLLVIEALLLHQHTRPVKLFALGGVGGGLFAAAPGFAGFAVVVLVQVCFGQRFPIRGVARVALSRGLPMHQALARIGIARGH